MLYTKRTQLTILELNKNEEKISIENLKTVLLERPSNMIYCESEGKLVGIISTGDIWRACTENKNVVSVNREFVYVCVGEYMKAKAAFKENAYINAIPVVTKDQILAGDYTRWDDLQVCEYLMEIDNGWCLSNLIKKEKIVLVRPGGVFIDRMSVFEKMQDYLKLQKVLFKCIKHSEVYHYLKMDYIILFVDENEIRACKTVQRIVFEEQCEENQNFRTYKSFFNLEFDFSDENCSIYLNKLQKEGIKVIGLVFEDSPFYKRLSGEMKERFVEIGEAPNDKWPQKIYEDFFDDLYTEEYADQITHLPLVLENHGGVRSLKDCRSKYYNVINGERYTVNQPNQYKKSIYFFGPCYIAGFWVEDKNTIESILQEHICREGIEAKVINCGTIQPVPIAYMYLPRLAVTQLKKGDIIVVDQPPQGIEGVYYLDLNCVLEKYHVGKEWMLEKVCHCNHRINRLYADAIYKVLLPVLEMQIENQGKLANKDQDFVRFLYLDRHFKDFNPKLYKKIGSVVINCNPFTYGHRYLIEQALQRVDFLIIFVVEQDKSLFSFTERFAMVRKGVGDLENVMVVPSGQFIASQMTIPEYFNRKMSENAAEHDEQDFEVFARQIASPLGIRVRFFGEEPFDTVTNQYNISAQKVLPQYGVEAVIIPRKMVHGKVVSASVVRKCLDARVDVDELEELLPDTTREMLGIG